MPGTASDWTQCATPSLSPCLLPQPSPLSIVPGLCALASLCRASQPVQPSSQPVSQLVRPSVGPCDDGWESLWWHAGGKRGRAGGETGVGSGGGGCRCALGLAEHSGKCLCECPGERVFYVCMCLLLRCVQCVCLAQTGACSKRKKNETGTSKRAHVIWRGTHTHTHTMREPKRTTQPARKSRVQDGCVAVPSLKG